MNVGEMMSEIAPGASGAAISFHYDVGEAFYRLWLDRSMTYSSALFDGAQDIETAQKRKLDWHLDNIAVERAARILDVGCGWGSLLSRAVERRPGLQATGLTLSHNQQDVIVRLALPGVSVRLESWREHRPNARYDGIVSVGAFEHFARPGLPSEQKVEVYREFFRTCRDWLKPGGALSLQTIAFGRLDERWMSNFITESIFPESMLPQAHEVVAACDRLLSLEILVNHADDYAKTCRQWSLNLDRCYEAAVALVGPSKVEDYAKYLRMSASAFAQRGLMLLRLRLRSYRVD